MARAYGGVHGQGLGARGDESSRARARLLRDFLVEPVAQVGELHPGLLDQPLLVRLVESALQACAHLGELRPRRQR